MNEIVIESEFSLDTVPIEVFLHICSFLDAKFLSDSVRLVCRRFHEILSDESIWKCRIKKKWPDLTLPLKDFSKTDITWTELCYHIEGEYDLWKRQRHKMKKLVWKDIHYSSVDAVKLLNSGRLVVSGSRDRTLAIWDVVTEGKEPVAHCQAAHTGWIWGLAAHNGSLYSCSWDATIKLWNIEPSLREVSKFMCTGSVLSVVCRDGLVAAGLYVPKVILFDPRLSDSVGSYTPHRASITALTIADDHYIVSASEDKSIAVWDLRICKPVTKNLSISCNSSFPMSIYYSHNLLYIGDNLSYLHLVSTNGGVFQKQGNCYLETSEYAKLTSVWHGPGCIMVGSTDQAVRIFTPTQPPSLITQLGDRKGEVTAIDYCNRILAVGCTDNSVEIWKTEDAFK